MAEILGQQLGLPRLPLLHRHPIKARLPSPSPTSTVVRHQGGVWRRWPQPTDHQARRGGASEGVEQLLLMGVHVAFKGARQPHHTVGYAGDSSRDRRGVEPAGSWLLWRLLAQVGVSLRPAPCGVLPSAFPVTPAAFSSALAGSSIKPACRRCAVGCAHCHSNWLWSFEPQGRISLSWAQAWGAPRAVGLGVASRLRNSQPTNPPPRQLQL